jgi:hypothetical protein
MYEYTLISLDISKYCRKIIYCKFVQTSTSINSPSPWLAVARKEAVAPLIVMDRGRCCFMCVMSRILSTEPGSGIFTSTNFFRELSSIFA